MARQKLTVGELVYKISGDMDDLKKELSKTQAEMKNLDKNMKKSKKSTGALTKGFSLLKGAALAAAAAIGYQFIRALKQSVQEAKDLQESTNAVNVVFEEASDKVLEFGRSAATSVGLARSEFNELVSQSGAIVANTGEPISEVADRTIELTQRAADLASVFNTEVDQAMGAIQSALVGQVRPLRQYAIAMSQAEIQNFALSEGIIETERQMTEQEKTLARLGFIMQESERFAGDFARTSDDLANRQRILAAEFKDVQANVGRLAVPFLEELISQLDLTGASSEETSEKMNDLGQQLAVIPNILGIMLDGFTVLKDLLFEVSDAFGEVTGSLGKLFRGGFELLTGDINGAKEALSGFFDEWNGLEDLDSSNAIQRTRDRLIEMFNIGGAGDNELQNEVESAWEEFNENIEEVGETTEESSEQGEESLEDFRSKLLEVAEEAQKTSNKLKDELSTAFDEFGKSAKENIKETTEGMAEIVLDAESEIERLQEKLNDTEDPEQRSQIEDQISEQEKILEAREGFEERQAERITAIREKLAEAGIDAEKAGLDNLMEVRSLEEEVEEQRRMASLDEFTRFEQQQAKKLAVLTDSFISEVSLIKEKIQRQKDFEQELTTFLENEEAKRLENTEQWVEKTLDKYKRVSDSLKGLLTEEQRLDRLNMNPTRGGVPETPTEQETSTSTTNNTNVSAPVTINGQNIQNLTPEEISSILGFKLSEYIK